MIEKIGTVESLEGEFAIVRAEDVQVHDNEVLAIYRVQTRFESDSHVTFYAHNEIGAKEGDRVKFTLPVKSFLDKSYLEFVFLALVILVAFVVNMPYVVIACVLVILYKLKPIEKKDAKKAKKDVPDIIEIIDSEPESA